MLAFPAAFLRASVRQSVWGAWAWPREAPYPPGCSLHPAARGHLGSPEPRTPPPKLKATLSGLPPPLEVAKGAAARPPAPLPVGPASRRRAARHGQGPEPGVRAAASRGQGRRRSRRAPPPARLPGPSPPRRPPPPTHPHPGPGPLPSGHPRRPALTGRRSPPGRQQERRRGIQRPRPGPGRSAARRSAAPPPAAARAEPKGSSLLAAPGISGRPSWQRLGAPPERARRAPGAALEASVRVREALPGDPVCTGHWGLLSVPRAGPGVMLNVWNRLCPRQALVDSAGCVQEGAAQGSAIQREPLSLAGHIFPGWLCRDRHRVLLEDARWPSPKQALPAMPKVAVEECTPQGGRSLLVAWPERALPQVELPKG